MEGTRNREKLRWPRSSGVPIPVLTRRGPLNLPSAQAGISRIKRSGEHSSTSQPHFPPSQSLGKVFLLGQNPVDNPSVCLPRSWPDPWRGWDIGRGSRREHRPPLSRGQALEGGKLESQAACPEWSGLHPARRRRPRRLGGSALSAIDHLNSFRYFLSHLLFKKNLMFSIIHPSQKIIDRARNENLSHIL